MKCRDCPIEIEKRPCPHDAGAWSVDDACVPLQRMLAAEWRLQEERKTLDLYEDLVKRYGYNGDVRDSDAEDPWAWLERQLAERRKALHQAGMWEGVAELRERECDEARAEVARWRDMMRENGICENCGSDEDGCYCRYEAEPKEGGEDE